MLHLNSAADATCLHSRLSLSLSLVFRIPVTILRIFYKSHRVVCLCVCWSVKQAHTVTVKCCRIFFTIRRIASQRAFVSFRSFVLLFGSTGEEQKKLIKFFMDVLCSVAGLRVECPVLGSASWLHSYLGGRRVPAATFINWFYTNP